MTDEEKTEETPAPGTNTEITDPETSSVPAAAPGTESPAEKVTNPRKKTLNERIKHQNGDVTVASDHFVARKSDQNGRNTVTITPVGWVGPAPLTIHPDVAGELSDVLGAL